jgi:hypothetical protein
MTNLPEKSSPFAALIEREKKSHAQIDDDLPILQMRIDGQTMSILPGDKYAFMAGTIVEAAGRKAIPREHIERAAQILRTEATVAFSGRVHDVVIGFATLTIKRWHAPRWIARLYDDLKRDPGGTWERHRDDPFAAMLIRELQSEVVIDSDSPELDTRRQFVNAICAAEGRLEDILRLRRQLPAIFWTEVAKVAHEHGCDLQLPSRANDRGGVSQTPLLRFAELMRELLVERGRMLLADYRAGAIDHTPGADDRFGRIAALRRGSIISALADAKREIL